MSLTFLRALLATTALVAIPTFAYAESIKDSVPADTLAAYCQEQGVGSETTATLTFSDGTSVTGEIECEAEDLTVADADGLEEDDDLDDADDDADGDDDAEDGDDDADDGDDDDGDDDGDGGDDGGDADDGDEA